MRLIIHAGLHRTATTTIQISLTQGADILEKAGVHYPIPSETTQYAFQHATLYEHCVSLDWESLDTSLQEIRASAVSHNCSCVLISAEDFTNLINHPKLFDLFLQHAESQFDSIEFVLVTRPLHDLFRSTATQELLHANCPLLKQEFLRQSLEHLCATLARWGKHSATHDVRFLRLKDLAAQEPNLVTAFVRQATGIGENALSHVPEFVRNVSNEVLLNPYTVLVSQYRAALAVCLNANPYSRSVEDRLEKAFVRRNALKFFADSEQASSMGQVIIEAIDLACKKVVNRHLPALIDRYPEVAKIID